ncbi:MAG TPA: hypothetical protein VM821_01650 [Abditibacteriaceae bacterium]|nr:hypothetical protein [Abditibacteriaceae bacterium]
MNNTTTNSNGHAGDPNIGAASDFIDFYQLLGADSEATTTALRRRINDLYTEAQSNRDHRNPTKRRRYEALCELLPYCRTVLLDPDKRARYDRYREQFEAGSSVPSFEQMMDEIAGRIDDVSDNSDEKIGLPGVEGDDNLLPVTSGSLAGASPRNSDASPNSSLPRDTHAPDMEPRRSGLFDKPSPRAAASRAASSSNEPALANTPPALYTESGANLKTSTTSTDRTVAPQPTPGPTRRPTSRSGLMPVVYAVVALLAVALASHFLLHQNWERSLLAGFVVGIVAYVISNMRSTRSKSGPRRPNRIT